jgi:putative ABC transport system ATP-binding protein
MIELKNVSKIYGKKDSRFAALENINLLLPESKTIAVVGKSGSGKSTLLHLLGGLDRPSNGEIFIHGQNLVKLKSREIDLYRSKVLGFVFQSFFVEANQTCYQNVSLPLEINHVPPRKRSQMIEKALSQVDLSDKIKSKAGTLSGGQKQRLAIARAIVNQPKVILADEPTGNLDSSTGDRVIDLLFALHDQIGSTLIIVTHDIDIANKCDIQVFIKDGHIEKVSK